jgi:hypothetical protein
MFHGKIETFVFIYWVLSQKRGLNAKNFIMLMKLLDWVREFPMCSYDVKVIVGIIDSDTLIEPNESITTGSHVVPLEFKRTFTRQFYDCLL